MGKRRVMKSRARVELLHLMNRVDLRSVKDNFNLGGTVHEGGLFPRTIEAFQFLGPEMEIGTKWV